MVGVMVAAGVATMTSISITITTSSTIVIDRTLTTDKTLTIAHPRGGNSNWQHNPQHRGGAPYSDRATANRFGGTARGDSMANRQANARQNVGAQARQQSAGGRDMSNRGAGTGAGTGNLNRGGGGDRVGNRQVSQNPSATNRSAFGGASAGISRYQARASSSRGSSSMGGARVEAAVPAVGGGDRLQANERGKHDIQTICPPHGDSTRPFCCGRLVAYCAVDTNAQVQSAHQPTAQRPKAFATPQQAAEELIKAAAAYDVPELMAIFGPDGEDLISSADPVRDKNNAAAFAQEAKPVIQ